MFQLSHLIKLIMIAAYLVMPVQSMMLIPMDKTQTDHLKAYGIVFQMLKEGNKVYWLLNYRGGSFAVEESQKWDLQTSIKGVTRITVPNSEWGRILSIIENDNMEKVTLEKAPKIAVYTPPGKMPWDDAVTLVLAYAEIPYEKIYDREVLKGKLADFDWLHLHHEDFTGQYSKFYRSFANTPWYQKDKMAQEAIAREMGFKKVTECKKGVALTIRKYVENGGFLFAMCSATNTLDITLATLGTDIVDNVYDGDGVDRDYRKKIDYANCMAAENFNIVTDPMAGNHDNIDLNQVNTPLRVDDHDFTLFDFSAKLDPVPTMLTQNHQRTIRSFYGLLTTFNKDFLKKSAVVLASVPGTKAVRYLHGVVGKGQFAFYGGHDPEDAMHEVGSKTTKLELHRNSAGYRLILNNVLFPAAEKKEKKT